MNWFRNKTKHQCVLSRTECRVALETKSHACAVYNNCFIRRLSYPSTHKVASVAVTKNKKSIRKLDAHFVMSFCKTAIFGNIISKACACYSSSLGKIQFQRHSYLWKCLCMEVFAYDDAILFRQQWHDLSTKLPTFFTWQT